jgi:hypothetical protein
MEPQHMKWIDEMFVSMEKKRATESAHRSARAIKVDHGAHLKKPIPGVMDAWNALLSTIANDVADFNKHKKRAGQTAVRVSHRLFECEVYLPGMHGKKLDLKLDGSDLQVTVHPDFPEQQLTITIEPDKEGPHGFWVLGEPSKESGKLSVQQLSEYLLRPILASADINPDL